MMADGQPLKAHLWCEANAKETSALKSGVSL